MNQLSKCCNAEITNCWVWTGSLSWKGYPVKYVGDTQYKVHRKVYSDIYGGITEGNQIHHLCEVKQCINPSHLVEVTPAHHSQLTVSPIYYNRRKTHCKRGHPYSGGNLYVPKSANVKNIQRRCIACMKIDSRNRQIRKEEARNAR